MFRQVCSENDKKVFDTIWYKACKEKGFELESSSAKSDLYLIYSNEDKPIGTVELIPYENVNNNADKVFPFYSLDIVKNNPTGIFEIDKVSLLKEHRGSNIKKILKVIYTYAIKNEYSYGIMLLEPTFYRALRTFYKFPINRVTKEKIFYKGDYVVPSVIDFEIINTNRKDFEWTITIKDNETAIFR